MGENDTRSFTILALIFTGTTLVLILLAGLIWFSMQPDRLALAPSTSTDTPLPTASATLTTTFTPTQRPTWTPRPSLTPSTTPSPEASLTSTPDRLPTLVSARPNQNNELYVLETWSAEKASEAARRMRELPDIRFKNTADRQTQAYNDTFNYPAIVYQEALLRYPQDLRAESWQWGLAYSLARLGDARAVELYMSFLHQALSYGSLPLANLPAWFNEKEPALQLTVHKLPNTPGQLGQSLLELEGGIFIWLVETPEQIYLYPLTTSFDFRLRPNGNPTAIFLSTELTGDSVPELVIYITPPTGDFSSPEPRVFNLSQATPVELSVTPALPFDYKMAFLPSLAESDRFGRFDVILKFYPVCAVYLVFPYIWNGSAFVPEASGFDLVLPTEELERCDTILTHAETFWEPELAAQISNALLPVWPPDFDLQGRLYPADAYLALQFRHAFLLALAGDQAAAQQNFQAILDDPTIDESSWKTAAQEFLNTYSTPANLYLACQAAPGCNASAALRQVIQSSGISDIALAQEFLRTSGVIIRSAGIFDFDLDGFHERWITVQHHPGDRLEFWILVSSEQGVQVLNLGYIETNAPVLYYSVSYPGQPVFQLGPRQGYRLLRHVESDLPYLTSLTIEPALTTYTRDALLAAEFALFSGTPPNEVRRNLELVLTSGRFNCKTHAVCDRFYYLLGLVYELNGQPRAAVDTYIKLWWENASSPLTTVARLKLKFIQTSKPTPTRTTTFDPYPIAETDDEEATPYPTPYPTPDYAAYPTPDLTAFPIFTDTPYPTP